MNQILRQIFRTGEITQPDGIKRKVHSHISVEEGEFLQHIIREIKPANSLEIGLAFGVSTHFICEALNEQQVRKHTMVEPAIWADGFALESLHSMGYSGFIELIHQPSHLALPQLMNENKNFDFVFIDGRHRFDYVFCDFFLADKLLNAGGVIVFDDADEEGVHKTCRFIATNRLYEVYKTLPYNPTGKRILFNYFSNMVSAWLGVFNIPSKIKRIFSPEFFQSSHDLGIHGSMVAFRKISHDPAETWNDRDLAF